MSTLAQFDVSDLDDSLFEGLPKATPQDVQPSSVAASLQAPKSEDALFEGLPKSSAPALQKAVTRNPDAVADAARIAKNKGVSVDLVERNYAQMSAQEKAEKNQRLLEAMGAGATADFMLDPTNAGMAHDDVENLVRVEQESNVFRAGGKVLGRSVPKVFQFYNQLMAYFSGTLDSAAKTAEELTGFKRGGVFKQAEQHYLAQSQYINDEVLNSELLKLPEHVTKSLWDNPQLLMNPEYLVTQVGEAASSMLPMMAAYVVSGGSLAVPSVIGGLQEASSLYEDLVRDGVDQESASMAATSFGVVVGLLNKVGLEELTKKIPTKTIMQNLIRRGAAGAAEGFTEYLEEPFQAAFSALAKGKSMDGVVQDVVASFKNVDVIPGAFLLGASGAVSGTAKRVENSALAAMKATQNGAQLAALSEAVAESKLGQRSPEKLGELINSVMPEEAKEQFIEAGQFATLFQEAMQEGQEVGSVEEVLSRLEVLPEVYQEALQQDTVMPLSMPTVMQSLTKEERDIILPHVKATPLSMSEAESVKLDLRGEAYRVFSEYSQDEEHKTALEAERTRIVDGLIKQGVHEEDAGFMAAIPHAFAQSYSTYGLDSVDFLRRVHVGEVGAYFRENIQDEALNAAQEDINTTLFQAAKKAIFDETGTIKFEYEDTGVEFDPSDRAKLREYFKSLEPPKIKALKLESKDAYVAKLKEIVDTLFPEGLSLKINDATGEFDYEYFLKESIRERYIHTFPEILRKPDVTAIIAKADSEKILFFKRFFDEELEQDIWDVAVTFNNVAQTKWPNRGGKGLKSIARTVGLETKKAQQDTEQTAAELGVSQTTSLEGNTESTSPLQFDYDESISDATDEVKTELNQGQRGSLSFLPDNNYLIKLAATADRSTFVHECAHVFLAELSRMTGQTQVFDQNVSSPKLDDLAAEQEMLGEAMNAGLEDSLSAINPEGKPYAEVNPEWAGKEEGYRTATIQKDFDDALHNNDDAYQAEKAKLAQVIESQATNIPPQLLKDMAVLRKWMRVKKDEPITTVHHEKFARGFETYLREGNAPSVELAQVFQRFRTWLMSIYKNAKLLHADLNDEVRDVFDRMVATNEQVAEAMHVNEMVEIERARLDELAEADDVDRAFLEREMSETERQATASMDRATLRDRNKRWREAREQAREVVENEPVYQAILWMTKRTGLDEAYMLEYYGKDTVKDLRQKHRGLIKKDGQHGDDIATEFGYDDSDSMVYAMVDTPSFKDRVEQLAEEFFKMEEAQLNPDEIVLAGESYGKYLEKYNAMLAKRIRSKTYSPREYLRGCVKSKTSTTTVREAMRYDGHQHTMRKHSQLRMEAAAKGNANAEAFHLEKLRLAHEFVGEVVRVREEAAKIVARAKKFAKSKSIETHYGDHIRALVQRFNMGGKSLVPKNPDHMSSLKTLIESQNDIMETAPSFPEWLVEGNESIDWVDLTVDELRTVNDLLKFLDHHGREQTKENERISKERIDNAAEATTKGTEKRKRKQWKYGTRMRKIMDSVGKVFASLDTLQYLLSTFDDVNDTGKDGERGANVRMIFDELVKAQNKKSELWYEMRIKINPALAHLRKTARSWEKQHGKSFTRIKLTDELRKQIGEGANVHLADQQYLELPVPEIMRQDGREWTADSILGLMLQTGTASNLERVYAGYPEMKENHVLSYLRSMLTHKDWDAIQQIWDAVDTLYPEIDKVHKQLNGFHMSKTEALPFGIERGGKIKKYQGGYFPAVYDSTLPQTHFIKQTVEMDEMISRAEAINQTPAARSGFTKGRKAKAPGFPLKLSVNVAVEHLYDTIHYVTHAEALRFADRLTRHQKWERAFTEVMGPAAYDAVRGHLKSIARPEKPVRDVWQKYAERFRVAATPFILGWNFGVAAKQVFSLPGGVHDIGMKEFCKGLKTVMSKNPRKQMQEIHKLSPFMRDRATSMDRELSDMANKFRMDVRTIEVFGKELSHQDAVDLGFWPIRMADMATTYVLWVSAYEKAMRQGKNPEEAVFYADDIIRKSQPSSQAIDQTMWQRHQGAMRMLSMFQTYTVRTFGARQRHHFRAMKAGKISKVEYAKYVLYDQIFPPIAMQLAFALLWGNAPDPDDDEAVLDFLLEMGAGVAMYQFAGLPLVSSVFSAFDADKTPAMTGMNLVQRSFKTGWAFLENPDDKQTERMLWSLFHLGSYVTRVPASQVARRFKKGMEQLEDGEGTPANLLIPEYKK